MLPTTDFPATLAREDEDEGLFSRDINGQLVRLDAPVERDYGRNITLQIDGQSVTVPMAEPSQDANGNIILDLEGRTTPRYTTIYDAVVAGIKRWAPRGSASMKFRASAAQGPATSPTSSTRVITRWAATRRST